RASFDSVPNANEDRILRRVFNLARATLRTNNWVRDSNGARKPFLSFKLDCSQIPELPDPRPMFEIWVYSTKFEAIHLRGGKVARGGLHWSDRPEDFRTEILGLMKAHMVQNTVIVHEGSQGSFVLKCESPDSQRETYLASGID